MKGCEMDLGGVERKAGRGVGGWFGAIKNENIVLINFIELKNGFLQKI